MARQCRRRDPPSGRFTASGGVRSCWEIPSPSQERKRSSQPSRKAAPSSPLDAAVVEAAKRRYAPAFKRLLSQSGRDDYKWVRWDVLLDLQWAAAREYDWGRNKGQLTALTRLVEGLIGGTVERQKAARNLVNTLGFHVHSPHAGTRSWGDLFGGMVGDGKGGEYWSDGYHLTHLADYAAQLRAGLPDATAAAVEVSRQAQAKIADWIDNYIRVRKAWGARRLREIQQAIDRTLPRLYQDARKRAL